MRISDWSSDVCSSDLGGLVEEDAPEVIAVRKDLVLVGQIGPARIHQVNARQPILLCDFLGPQVLLDGQRIVGSALDRGVVADNDAFGAGNAADAGNEDRKSTRLNSSH